MIGVNLDATAMQALDTQLKNDLAWRSFYDGNYGISEGYGIFSIPTIIVIDPQGKIQWIGHQFNDGLIAELVANAQSQPAANTKAATN